MADHLTPPRRSTALGVVGALVFGTVGLLTMAPATPAAAFLSPVVESGSGHVTADPLPTVQINGVAYDQEIIGNMVYVVGDFTSARPFGSPPGTNETPKSHILAYNITDGVMSTTFNAVLGASATSITKSPDGSRLYVGGSFVTVNGINRYRLAAINPADGSLITSFSANAQVDFRVNALVATNTTLYAGGAFNFSAANTRSKLAAFSTANGSLLAWAPSADAEVHAMVMSPDGSKLIVGGKFGNLNGQQARGTGALDPSTGALLPWAMNNTLATFGPTAGFLDLQTDGQAIFGNAFHFGGASVKFEGLFSANPATGELNWVNDCHGDTYASFPMNGYLYGVSHAHYCGNNNGFPQSEIWPTNMRHATSVTTNVTGHLRADPWNYISLPGMPSPSMVAWAPEWETGTITTAGMASWTVEGNGTYLAFGGEFPQVNQVNQQGLVRFAVKSVAPADSGPRAGGAAFVPVLRSTAAGEVTVAFKANYDRDNLNLTYDVIRNNQNNSPVYSTTFASTYWNRPSLGFVDKGLSPGSTQIYRVRVTDPDGNVAWGDNVSVVVAASGTPSPYAEAVLADTPTFHWRFGEAAGSTDVAIDAAGVDHGTVVSGIVRGEPGAMPGEPDTSYRFGGTTASRVYQTGTTRRAVSETYTIEAWIRTTTNTGGRIIGFSSSTNSTSSSSNYDRHIYMANDGRVFFGANQLGSRNTVNSPTALNDGQWHHLVGTQGDDGLALYVDGKLAASRADTFIGRAYYGFWRVGGDALTSWPSSPLNANFTGWIDEPAVYELEVLSADRIAAHYNASGRTAAIPAAPADSYGALVYHHDPALYYRLDEPNGAVANDSGLRGNHADIVGSVVRGTDGVLLGNDATSFDGTTATAASRTQAYNPTDYSVEAWFNTTSTSGGSIVNFGNNRSGLSTAVSRQVLMNDAGQIVFRSGLNGAQAQSTASFNNGTWHHVVATQSVAGMQLYVDGALVGSNVQAFGPVVSGYWRIGGDETSGASTSDYLAGALDEVAVYDEVLSSTEVAQHHQLGSALNNLAPTAAFTSGISFLDVTFDGSGSTDLDGTIVSYAWNFGDAGNGTGVSATHSYAAAGTYTVTLTVTDDHGVVDTETQQVTVTAPPPNNAPTAAYSSTANFLAVTFNGSGSADPDGTIVSYDWTFGNGATATGPNPSYTYPIGGTYTVTLLVTDDDGASDTETKSIVVADPPGPRTFAVDAFNRTLSNSWGAADVGGSWTTGGATSQYAVTGAVGTQRIATAGGSPSAYLNSAVARDSLTSVDVSWDKVPTPSTALMTASVVARRTGTSDYRSRVRVNGAGAVTLTVSRVVSGVETTIQAVTVTGLTYAAGESLRLQLEVEGVSPTTLRSKVWKVGQTEPAAWQITTTDATAALQTAGGAGLVSFLSSSATNAPVVVSFESFSTRSTSDVVNTPPTSAFTYVANNLQVAFDGTSSSDADGTIASYAWDFAGTPGSGPTTSFTFPSGGTYTVGLTVTDNFGATNTSTQQVTVVAPPTGVLAQDLFERNVATGFGNADQGGTYTYAGTPANFSVSGGRGRITIPSAGTLRAATLPTLATADVDATVDLTIDKLPTGGGGIYTLSVRKVGTSEYSVRVRVQPAATTLQLVRTVNGVATSLASRVIAGYLYTPGDVLHLRVQAVGSGTTTLRGSMWVNGQTDPGWLVSIADTTAGLQVAGGLAVTGYLSGSSTEAPVVLTVDNLVAIVAA